MPTKTKQATKHHSAGFYPAYERLNKAQRKAVDTIEGPVMVIAGPGTGKTETVAMRVANILRKTQMRPSNILCLTFSTSGAKAMRERMRSIIGSDAYGVTVETVHSFCNEIIQQHPHVFEDFRALEQVSDIERLRIMRRLMRELGPGSVLGRTTLETDRASAILSRISEMKREGIAIDYLQTLTPSYRAEIDLSPSGKERNKDTQSYRDDVRLVQQYEEFIILYAGYNTSLRDSHRYDYEDMVLSCNAALKKHAWMLANLQERFQYILVDEFQDLNGAQNETIELLLAEPMENQEPNIFVVGDDDQAIYRFQGANIGNMQKFLERHPQSEIISLTENYRSTQAILDAASNVITHNEERLVNKIKGIDKNLKAMSCHAERPPGCGRTGSSDDDELVEADEGRRRSMNKGNASSTLDCAEAQSHSAQHDTVKPTFLRYPAIENERAGIVSLLTEANREGIPWNTMAVLCRRNSELAELYDVLLAGKIPVILTAKQDLLLHAEVRQTMVILKAIEQMNTDHLLSAGLCCPSLRIPPADLGALWTDYREARRDENPPSSLRSFLMLHSFSSSLESARDLFEELSAMKEGVTLPALLESVLKKTHLLPNKDDRSADPRVIAGLHAFYDYMKDRIYENKGLTLATLLADLDEYLHESNLTLEYTMPHLVSDGVELMTAHGAKGLEFELVIIAHARYRNWGNRFSGSLLSLPNHLIFGVEKEVEKRANQEDERRLIYVAMTRAKHHLFLTFPETYRSGADIRDAQPSSFVAEAGDTLNEVTIPAAEVPAPIETLYREPLHIDEAFEAFLHTRIENFQLSVTALNAFLENPQEFLWTHLLLQPQAKAAHLAYGSAVHAALEKRNLAWKERVTLNGVLSEARSAEAKNKDEVPFNSFNTTHLIAAFQKTMQEREVFTEEERAQYLHIGTLVLERYGRETEREHPIIHSAEKKIRAQYLDIPLVGKVDRIDLFDPNGATCRIIDYKTGTPKKTETAIRKDENLFRQLVFYKLLCDLSPSFSYNAVLFTLDFVGDEKNHRRVFDFEILQEEVDALKDVIKKVWEKIIALDFS